MADLTDADIAAIERRLSEGRMAATIPQPRPLAGWEKEAADAQAARREQRRIAAQAEQERLIREREREAERRRLEWEANAPQRAEAQAELADIERQIADIEARQDDLYSRASELRVLLGPPQ